MREPWEGEEGQEDRWAAALRGFGPIGVLAILVILAGNFILPPASALLVLLWVRWSRTPWQAIGYVRPRSWPRTLLGGVLFGVALKLAMKSLIMPLLGAPPLNAAYQFLFANTAAMLGMLVTVIVVAGWGEETLFRGYLFERLGKLLGSSLWAKAAIVALTSAYFGSLHFKEQGLAGAEQAAMTGLVFGTIYAVTGRLWPLVVIHAAFDVTAVAIIYAGVEREVAHWFFR